MDETLKKMLQKRVYDLLSHKYGILMLLAGSFLITISAFHFGEAWLEWSQEKYEAVFNSFSDNVAGKSFRERLSVPLPIDVVYTWVNGTDPDLIHQLELVKVSKEELKNLSREEKCTYTNCLSVGILLYPPLADNTVLAQVMTGDEMFKNATDLRAVKETKDGPTNFTMISLEQETDVKKILQATGGGWNFQNVNHTVKAAFYTSDVSQPHGLVVPEMVMMSGFPSQFSTEDVLQAITKRLNVSDKTVMTAKIYSDKGVALLHLLQKDHYDMLVKDKNFTIEGKEIRLSAVKLVWDLKFAVTDDVVAANRFEDNEELRYSLRSVEQFAPWVRHIFIVTNGQIPYWLNLDNPRLTVITHDEIFLNQSHLPTFSSPAIEANIHRIPGLSDKFLYLNDDVMFGSPVWPDDFYTHSTGQKMYLTWPVPNCNDGCPSTWIRDGYCDKACNSSECDWDGGDCTGKTGQVQLGAGFHGDQANYLSDYISYCATGCANNWLADKYCDQACNNLACGFDIGDCGVTNYNQLYNLGQLQDGYSHYSLPPGELIGYFNVTDLIGEEGKVTAARYKSQGIVRAVAVANKFKVLTVILKKGHNATKLFFDLNYTKGGNHTYQVNMTLSVDTSVNKTQLDTTKETNQSSEVKVNMDDELDSLAFQGELVDLKGLLHPRPKQVLVSELPLHWGLDASILDVYKEVNMTGSLREELFNIEAMNKEGEVTDVGLKFRLSNLLKKFGAELESLLPVFHQLKQEAAARARLHRMEEAPGPNLSNVASAGGQASNRSLSQLLEHHGISGSKLRGNQSLLQKKKDLRSRQEVVQLEQFNLSQSQKDQPNPGRRIIDLDHDPNTQEGRPGDPGMKPLSEHKRSISLNSTLLHTRNRGANKGTDQDFPNSERKNNGQSDLTSFGDTEMQDVDGGGRAGDLSVKVANQSENYQLAKIPGRKLLAILYWSDHLARLEEERERAVARRRENGLGEMMTDEEFLQLVKVDGAEDDVGGFPWERRSKENPQETQQDSREKETNANEYVVEGWQGRQLLDTFGDSLRHVNRIYNKEFGFTSRKVPGHMPHMVDKNVMQELQDRFPEEWDATSSHKIRSSTDMQYAFAYYYYLMGVTEPVTVEDVFDRMDTDHSGILSDREIRTLATRLYELPLFLETLTGLETMLTNCSQHLVDPSLETLTEDKLEQYFDKEMPQVTKYLFTNCDVLVSLVTDKFKPVPKYKTSVVDESDIAFKMIHTNVSHVVGQLDDIRKHSKKFICLNDNIDHRKEDAKTVKAILQDFYESLLPNPSQFELPRDYRNRFLHVDELREWRKYRDRLRFWTHVALGMLVFLTVVSFLGEKIESLRRKWANRKRRRRQTSSSSESPPSSVAVTPTTKTAESSDCAWWGEVGIETV